MRRLRLLLPAVVVIVLLVVVHATVGGSGPRASVAQLPVGQPAAAAGDSLIVEPDDGMGPVYALLASPRRSLDLTMYELVDPTAESVLVADARRGVAVRVVLDSRLERQRNTPAYDFLRARGVAVHWSSGRYFATHEKAMVIDGRLAVVMSLNLTDRYYPTSRDLAVVDRDPVDAAAIDGVFDADFGGRSFGTPAADDLVWSPGQSGADLVALIDRARRSVAVESEELSSQEVIAALVRAAHRGVQVSVAMTYQSDWQRGFDVVAAAGGTVGVLHGESPLYIHAKLLAIDAGQPDGRAFVGSTNLSDASLWHDRELGIVLVSPRLVDEVAGLIAGDVGRGERWR